MATTRFCSPASNLLLRYDQTQTYPRIINGDSVHYTNPPALQQEAQYPMANIHNPDRYTPWVSPADATPSPLLLHVDLGASVGTTYVGLHGFRALGAISDVSFELGYQTTYVSGGTWTQATTLTLPSGARDKGTTFATATGRYWQFKFTGTLTAGLSFGSIYLGNVTSDLGFLYSPGEIEDLIHTTVQSRTGAGHLVSTVVGDARYLVTMPFRSINDTDRGKIDAVFGYGTYRDPAVWLDRASAARQVVLARDALAWQHAWAPPNAWDCDLELEVLG